MSSDSTRQIRHSSNKGLSNGIFTDMFKSDPPTNSHSVQKHNNTPGRDSYYGTFSIKSPCSDKYVRIYNYNISAKNDYAAQIQFQKIRGTENQFYIRRTNARKFLCISRRGKLLIRPRPTNDHRCAFTQIPTESSKQQSDNLSVKIQSVARSSWYLGFKNNGDPMKAWQYGLKRDICFHLQIQKFSSLSQGLLETQSLFNSKHRRHALKDDDNNSHLETT